jgi:hypothetical protein
MVTIRTGDLAAVDVARDDDESVTVSPRTTHRCLYVQPAAVDVVARHIDLTVSAHESDGVAPVTTRRNIRPREGNSQEMASQRTVRDVTYDLLRSLELTTVFGNPGSTEETSSRTSPPTSPMSSVFRKGR